MSTIKIEKFIEQNVHSVNLKYVDFLTYTGDSSTYEIVDFPISVEVSSKDFSFKNNLADNEFVQNPNIFETQDYSRIKNMPLDMVDKFDNQDDPFFDFDEQRPAFESVPLGSNVIQKQTIRKVTKKMASTSIARSSKSKTYGVKK